LVYSIYDSTEEAIQKMIEASKRMIVINSQGGEGKEGEGMNPAINRHFELEINTLRNAPRDADKLERLLKAKEREKKQATEEDIAGRHTKTVVVRVKGYYYLSPLRMSADDSYEAPIDAILPVYVPLISTTPG
jgi:methyl coenzyme M reductase beta subunit